MRSRIVHQPRGFRYMETRPAPAEPTAWIVLPGHADAPAHLSVVRYSPLARLYRTAWYAFLWITSTVATFLVTIFDPFMTSMPLFIGAVMTYRSWRGRFRVTEFRGACPRCREPIDLKAGSRIGTPHHLVCYNCHHEPELYLAA
ncbi:MAG: hypothetical protein KY467_18720 [Gemmatimonadetes bacterium]|nr:hypothetical protein [Gemmatimonadota bacterium]